MKAVKIGVVNEVVNSDNSLIGSKKTPQSGGDLESQAGRTTDYNAKVSHQPFRYDMLGRFGFSLFPFFEGKEDESQKAVLDELAEVFYDRYMEFLKYYYKHPEKLKNEYRKLHGSNFETQPEEKKNIDYVWAKKVMKILQPHVEKSLEGVEKNISESVMIEDKVVEKKPADWRDEKSDDKEIGEKGVKKIAGLLNKMNKEELDKVISLLEID
jgi:hypothetical protein